MKYIFLVPLIFLFLLIFIYNINWATIKSYYHFFDKTLYSSLNNDLQSISLFTFHNDSLFESDIYRTSQDIIDSGSSILNSVQIGKVFEKKISKGFHSPEVQEDACIPIIATGFSLSSRTFTSFNDFANRLEKDGNWLENKILNTLLKPKVSLRYSIEQSIDIVVLDICRLKTLWTGLQ